MIENKYTKIINGKTNITRKNKILDTYLDNIVKRQMGTLDIEDTGIYQTDNQFYLNNIFFKLDNPIPNIEKIGKNYLNNTAESTNVAGLGITNNGDNSLSIEGKAEGHYKTVQGTSFTLTDADSTKQASILELKGNTSQEGTPSPSSPVEVETVTGDNNIVVGNNILILNMQEYAKQNSEYFSFSYENGLTALKKDNRAMANVGYLMEVQPNTTYYVKTETDQRLLIAQYSTSTAWVRNDEVYNGGSFTTNSNVHYLRCKIADTLTTFPTVVGKTYISLSSNYQGNSYRVDLGGKNLFNYANTTITNSGITTTYNNGEISYSGTATTTYANLTDVTSLSLPVGTYTFSREGTNNVKITLRVWNTSNTRTDYNINANNNTVTFTISEKTDRTYLFLAGLTANTQYSGNIKVQLEKRKYSNSLQSLCI